jgi:hypothetical protein
MATNRPLRFDETVKSFRQMSDAELDILSYVIRKKYAQLLSSGTATIGGKISPGTSASNYSSLGSVTDTVTLQYTAVNADSPTGGADNIFPTTLDSSYHQETETIYNYRQYIPSINLSSSTLNSYSYLVYDQNTKTFKIEGDISNIFDTIVSDCVNKIHDPNSDGVGSYHFGLSSPTSGTYVDMGMIYQDTTYWNSTVQFNHYIKTAADNENDILNDASAYKYISRYIGIVDDSVKISEIPINDITENIVVDILEKILEKRFPKYTLTRIGSTDSSTTATTTMAGYTSDNFGFLHERFVFSSYTVVSTSGVSGGTYTANYQPDNNSYRYNVWALTADGYNTTDL